MLKEIFTAPIWQKVYWGNSVFDYLVFLFATFALLVVFKIFQSVVLSRLKKLAQKTKSDLDDELIKIVQSLKPPFYSFLAFYLSLSFLALNEFLRKALYAVLIIWVVYQAVAALQILINYIVRKKLPSRDQGSQTMVGVISVLLKGSVWAVALILMLQNLGVNVTSLIAGLGIGGIAVAMAVQNILSDLFSSFAIYFDKPFLVGDFIVSGDTMGVVKKIGIKTTRIQALQGEEIVVSNKELTSTRIQNFKKMKQRRVVFSFGVVYETPQQKLEKIPELVKSIVESVGLTRFERAHFKKFDDSALSFEVVYYILSPDYNQYMDTNQKILFEIKKTFEREGISMAYPTQTIYINKDNF
jgi:small-conductance mechanosensitive channel